MVMTMPATSIHLVILSVEPKTIGIGPKRRTPPTFFSVPSVGRPLPDAIGSSDRNIRKALLEVIPLVERKPRRKDARISKEPRSDSGPRDTKTGNTRKRYTSPSPCQIPWISNAAPTMNRRRAKRVGTLMTERAGVQPLTFS